MDKWESNVLKALRLGLLRKKGVFYVPTRRFIGCVIAAATMEIDTFPMDENKTLEARRTMWLWYKVIPIAIRLFFNNKIDEQTLRELRDAVIPFVDKVWVYKLRKRTIHFAKQKQGVMCYEYRK